MAENESYLVFLDQIKTCPMLLCAKYLQISASVCKPWRSPAYPGCCLLRKQHKLTLFKLSMEGPPSTAVIKKGIGGFSYINFASAEIENF